MTSEEIQVGDIVTFVNYSGYPAEKIMTGVVEKIINQQTAVKFIRLSSKKYNGYNVFVGEYFYGRLNELTLSPDNEYLKKYDVLLIEKMRLAGMLDKVLQGGIFEGLPNEWMVEVVGKMNGKDDD